MHPYLTHIRNNNDVHWADYLPLHLAGRAMGFLHSTVKYALMCEGLIKPVGAGAFGLVAEGETPTTRSTALASLHAFLVDKNLADPSRDECYAVNENFDTLPIANPIALADRSMMPVMGFRSTGIHCNAFVMDKGEMKIWTARRSATAKVAPNKLDHLVAGGQPHGLSLRENLAKEAWEEAGVPIELVQRATPHGRISYNRANTKNGNINGVRRDTLFLFDLELPLDFTPTSMDGESGEFRLLSVSAIKEKLLTDEFKFNIPLVLIDFLDRHGFLNAEEKTFAAKIRG